MSAVGPVAGSASASAPAPAGLDAQKTQIEKQLADCVNCSSSKTAQGQARISALSSQLAAVEARMQRADEARAEAGKPASGEKNFAVPRPLQDPNSSVGRNVDAFA